VAFGALDEAARFFSEVVGPTNRDGDLIGSVQNEDGSVSAPESFKKAYEQYVAAGWGAVIGFLLALSPEQNLRGMLFWLMGDLAYAGTPLTGFVVLLTGLLIAFAMGRSLNILAHGELAAATLGVPVATLRRLIYVLASVLTAAAVTMAGSIGFVGLVVPHMLRLQGVRDHRLLLPAAALLGGSLLLIADTLARTLLAPRQLPVGILTALVGVPVFLLLLYRSRDLHGREG